MPDSFGLDILRFLKAEVESGKSNYVRVIELANRFDLSFQEMVERLAALEAEGYVEGIHSHGGSGYLINKQGLGYLKQSG